MTVSNTQRPTSLSFKVSAKAVPPLQQKRKNRKGQCIVYEVDSVSLIGGRAYLILREGRPTVAIAWDEVFSNATTPLRCVGPRRLL